MSEHILTRKEIEGLIERLRCEADSIPDETTSASWVSDLCNTTADALRALYDSQAADRERIAALERALAQIRDQEPKPFDFPKDWSEQIAACLECKRYKGHPIQQGICDQHRKPLYAREAHESFERKAMGYRASSIARNALQPTPPQECDG